MKKWLSFLCVLVLAMGVFSAAAYAEEKVYEMKFASASTQTGIKLTAVLTFLDEVERLSEGRINVVRYIDGEVVQNAEDLLVMIGTGSLQGGIEGDMSLSWVAPEWLSYASVPFAFSSREHLIKFYMSEVGQEINQRLIEQHHLRFLDSAVGGRGGRMLTANRPIKNPADLSGIKFRVPNVIGTVASWEAMGAKVIGVPWSELFTALQNGLVDAQENPYAELESGAFYQVQKYVMETAHQFGPQFVFVNEDFYQSLPADLQQVLQDANKAAWDLMNTGTEEDDARIRQKVIDAGVTIIPREEIDIEGFKQIIIDKVLPQFADQWAEGGWEYIQSLNE